MARVIGLEAPAGDWFAATLLEVWELGHAAFPIDPNLPGPARDELLTRIEPTDIWSPQLRHRHPGLETEDGDALIVATSGTTGPPKGVVLTHAAVLAAAQITSAAVGADPATDCWALCLPVHHLGGLGVLTRALLTGTPLAMAERCTAGWVNVVEATLISLVPAALAGVDAGRFRTILLGGSAIPPDRPPNAIATYGMTETTGGIVYDGRPLSGVEMREVDAEIQLRSPTLLRAYRDGSNPKTADGWLPTGDLGAIVDGVLTVHGRADDVIVTGGEKVWPAAVEAVLAQLPGIQAVVVVGRPDARWGEAVTAIVLPADPAAPPSLDELRGAVRERLPVHAAPHRMELVEELPVTSLGKVRRSAL